MAATVSYRAEMSSSDALIWHIERDPTLRSTVMGVMELDRVPAPERMRESLHRMVTDVERFHQRVVEQRPRPRWLDIDAADIDLTHHFCERELPAGSTMSDAYAFAQDWVREPFERNRPLWRVALLTGLPDGKAAVVFKVHHAIADGIGMVLIVAAFTDLEPNPTTRLEMPAGESHERRAPWSRGRRWRHRAGLAARAVLRSPADAIASVAALVASAMRVVWPSRRPHSTLMTRRSTELCLDSRRIPLATLKHVGRAAGVSINDVFVSIVSDGVARYHDRMGHDCERLRLHVPVNIRNERTATLAGNQFVPARISLNVPMRGATTGLVDVRAQLERLRSEPALPHVNAISAAIQRFGVTISRFVIGGMMKGVDVLASNVPGPNFPLYLAGAEIDHFVAFGPPAGAGINITLFSYRGNAYLGINADAAAVRDRMTLLECLDEAIGHATSAAHAAGVTRAPAPFGS
jgi:diacylglycerol O-acyltransferase / wax synthase